jgi:hypothetical protein
MTFALTDAQAGTGARWRAGEKSRRSGGELICVRRELVSVAQVQALSELARPDVSEKDHDKLRSFENSLRDVVGTPLQAGAAAEDLD